MDTLCSDLQQLFVKQCKASESCLLYLDQNIDHQLYLNVQLSKMYRSITTDDNRIYTEIWWSYYDRFKMAVDNGCTPWILEILSIVDNDTALCYCIENKLEWLFDRYDRYTQILNYSRIAHCYLVNGYYDQYKGFEPIMSISEEYTQDIADFLGMTGKDFFTKINESFFMYYDSQHYYGSYVKGLATGKHLDLLRAQIPTINEYCDYIDMVLILVKLEKYEYQLEFAQYLELDNCYNYKDFKQIARDLADPNDYNCPQLLQYLIEFHRITDIDDLLNIETMGPI